LKPEDCATLIEAARADIRDALYTQDAAKAAISILSPSITIDPRWKFGAIDLGNDGFIFDTNIDFSLLDTAYKKIPGQEGGSLTEALIASYIFGARVDSYFACSDTCAIRCHLLS
jgi:hypothetical protein